VRAVKVGDKLQFLCNGKGRGGHYQVTVRVKKVNRKTIEAVELARSYTPGTQWKIHFDTDVYIMENSPEWLEKYGDPKFEAGDKVEIDRMFIREAGKKGVVVKLLESEEYVIQLSGSQVNVGPNLLKKI
jgi:hypothetical protein